MNVASQRVSVSRIYERRISEPCADAGMCSGLQPRKPLRARANSARYCNTGRRMGHCRRPRSGFNAEASTASALIKLQILLRRQYRTPEAADQVRKILLSLGLTPTAVGLATLSADAEPSRFESLFGVKTTEILPRPPGKTDFGASGGHVSPDLPVPATLQPYVESISAAPPHTYLQH
jgi:hypothetical protein